MASLLVTATSSFATYPGADGLIVFVHQHQIFTISSTGTDLHQLTGRGENFRPVWSPDGSRIAYIHETRDGARDVWVMRSDGLHKRQVTQLGDVGISVTWRPDGNFLAFSSGADAKHQQLEKVTATPPFGTPIPLSGYYTGCGGCDPTSLQPMEVDRYLAWSPEGGKIAIYNHYDGYFDNAIYMYHTHTHVARELKATGADCCRYADWSDLTFGPDGTFGYTVANYNMVTFQPKPTKIRYSGFASIPYDKGAAPSPSGQYMAFTNSAAGTPSIYVANIDGSDRHLVVRGYQPNWQPVPAQLR